jgi:uncharacterized protein involved in exopolysaccharide biosynthesis
MRLTLEHQLTETPPTIPVQPSAGLGKTKVANTKLIEDYRKKEADYEELAAKYTPKHPEVQAAKAELDRLQAKIPAESLAQLKEEEADPKANTIPNPLYQNLTAQLEGVKTEFQIREDEKKYIESEITKYSQRVNASPQSEQEISDITRQNTDLNKRYTDLKDHLAQAKLSESLESRQKGSQFQIIDPANYPLLPSKPEKAKIAMIGALLSLGIGIAVALIVDIMSQRIWLQSEVESIFGVVVLGEIPAIVTKDDLAISRRKKKIFAISSAAAVAAYSVALYFVYIKKAYVLVKLDPLIQRLMQ